VGVRREVHVGIHLVAEKDTPFSGPPRHPESVELSLLNESPPSFNCAFFFFFQVWDRQELSDCQSHGAQGHGLSRSLPILRRGRVRPADRLRRRYQPNHKDRPWEEATTRSVALFDTLLVGERQKRKEGSVFV